ncbi:hypothetical protein lpari_03874 [Legionella parisiensis]|uniref:Uncharacterized protein n=1 Tax=Legionella parisiensis TaxID=45071 RepID=A0A1E5JKR9_9GAMM|nr:hypothetical protein lpari_03874 [Legionella parisiensis]STX77894.1 Uncharacterised protein [Legionella parisiensis]
MIYTYFSSMPIYIFSGSVYDRYPQVMFYLTLSLLIMSKILTNLVFNLLK